MYTLYHIPERKEWGCTNDLNRRLRQLKYKIEDLDRVITCGNVDMASDMERDLNLEYGYGWNSSNEYKRVIKIALKGTLNGSKTRTANHIKACIPIIAINIKTKEKINFNSSAEASRVLNVYQPHIYAILKGRRKRTKDWTFIK